MSTSWICVDANLVVRLLVNPDDTPIRGLWRRWRAAGQQLVAPTLLNYEVTNALYRYQKQQLLPANAVSRALEAALALPIELHAGEPDLHREAVQLATRFVLPAAYDAHYLAVAQRLGAPFWTADSRLAHTVQPALPWVHLVGD